MSEQQGLYKKYDITKADGTPTDPNADYFVLRLDTDPIAREAARCYATLVQQQNPLLAFEIRNKLNRYEQSVTE